MKANLQETNKTLRLSTVISFALLVLFAQPQRAVAQQWNTNGNNISNANTGNVGIGTTTPTAKLEVAGSVHFDGHALLNSSWPLFVMFDTAGTPDQRQFYFWNAAGGLVGRWVNDANSAVVTESFMFRNNGFMGIGTTSPNYKVEVQGSSSRNTLALFGDGDAVGYAGIKIGAQTTTGIATNRTSQFNLHMRKDNWYGGDGSGPSFIIEANSKVGGFAAPFLITPTNDVILNGGTGASGLSYGNVGIGTTNPGYKLDVQGGSINTAGGLCIAGDCKTAWSQVGGQWITSGNSVYYNTGNVGIGTINPAAALDVVGSGRFQGPVANISIRNTTGWTQAIVARSTGQAAFISAPSVTIDANNPYWATGLGSDGSAGWTLETWDGQNMASRIRVLPNGNMGIGSTSPGYKLDVQGGSINSAGGLCIAGDCKTAWSQVGGGSTSQWSTSGSNVYYNGGNVGIGTNAPLGPLSVGNSAVTNSDGYLVVGRNDGSGGSRQFRVGFDASFNFVVGDYGNNNTAGTWLSPFAINWQAPSNSLYISSVGNVGIGTSTPAVKLHVQGDGRVAGNLTVDGNIAAKYQDVAEWVPAAAQIPAGTVVVLDPTVSNQVIASTQPYDTRVAGVISEQPGIALGESGNNKVLVATTGRVRIKVDATRGPIHIGDLLVTSDISGMAMKSEPVNIGGVQIHRPGTLIGKALEPLAKGQGEILVLLSLQ